MSIAENIAAIRARIDAAARQFYFCPGKHLVEGADGQAVSSSFAGEQAVDCLLIHVQGGGNLLLSCPSL